MIYMAEGELPTERYKFPTDRDLTKEEIGHVYGERERKDWPKYSEDQNILAIASREPLYIGDIVLIWDYKEGKYVVAKVVGHVSPELDIESYSTYAKGSQYKEKTTELIKKGHTEFLERPSLYDVDAFGVLDKGSNRVQPLTFAPHPRASVVSPTFEEVCLSLNLPEKGVPLGVYMTGNMIYLHFNKAITLSLPYGALIRHILIAGTTGVGKTEILKHIAVSLANVGFAVPVIDLEGEWLVISQPADTSGFTVDDKLIWTYMGLAQRGVNPLIFSYAPEKLTDEEKAKATITYFSINFADLSGDEMRYYLPGLSSAAMEVLPGLVNEYRRTNNTNKLYDFIAWIRRNRSTLQHISHEKTSELIVRCAGAVVDIFDRNALRLNGNAIVKSGQISVISLVNVKEKGLATRIVILYTLIQLSKAAENRKDETPTEVLVDESHRVVPRMSPPDYQDYQASVNHLIENIARLGRRRWMGLIFATHTPDDLSPLLFNLCNTKIFLQMSGPVLESISRDLPVLSGVRRRLISSFPQGRALLFSPTLRTDVIIQFPRSIVFHRQAEKDLEGRIEEWIANKRNQVNLKLQRT